MSASPIFHDGLAIKALPLIADDDEDFTIHLLKADAGIQGPRMFDDIKEQFAYRLEHQYADILLKDGVNAIRMHSHIQTVLLLHLGGQPDDRLSQSFALQDWRAEINTELASGRDGLGQPVI